MFRKSAVAAALLLATVAKPSFALGLGDIDMRSALNQPMDATIRLTSVSDAELDTLRVTLASVQEHSRAGLTKAAILTDFRFTVGRDSDGKAVIRVRSQELVREPYLEFLLELDWPNGRLLREYTVLVDPPVTMPSTPAAPVAAVSQARAPAPVVSKPKPVRTAPPPRATTTPPATVQAAPATPHNDSYGPIRRSETLWNIAERVRPGNDITVHQMMLALQRANPSAFLNNNINHLKAGVTLNIPSRDEVLSITAGAARAETRRQYSEWKADHDGSAPTQATPAAAAPASADPAVVTESRLQLMAPEASAVSGDARPGEPDTPATGSAGKEVEQQLALATEEVAAERAQSAELKSRVGELEEQVATMKRLLELKDAEMARLQQTFADNDIAVPESDASLTADISDTTDTTVAELPAAAEDTPEVTAAPDTAAADAATTSADPEHTTGSLQDKPAGLVDRLMENPLLAGVGALLAALLGGFLWASMRNRSDKGIFDEEMTMERQLAASADNETRRPLPEVTVHEPENSVPAFEQDDTSDSDSGDSDAVAEADVYLAYGRIQQAEDVLRAALESRPDYADARYKLLEVYHAGGNAAAFDQAAQAYHDVTGGQDERWQKVVTMGLSLSPHNALYGGAAPAPEENMEFDMDLSGLDELPVQEVAAGIRETGSNTVEFSLDEDDDGDGLLDNADEVTTKLDLARAYIDMDDKDSARSILGEVIEEGNAEQKEEAENIIAKLA